MAPFSWSRWLRSFFRPQAKTFRRRNHPLGMEQLETRVTPATYTWTGLGGNSLWSTPGNWLNQNNVAAAPVGLATAPLDDLVFPAGALNTSAQNDLGQDTSPATFGSISIGGSNYSLTGNTIILGSSVQAGSGSVNVSGGQSGNVIGFDALQFGNAPSDRQFFNVDFGATLKITSQLVGNTGTTLAKDLPGTLVIAPGTNDNSGFFDNISVDTNGGVLQVTGDSRALGAASNLVTVNPNAQLQLNNVNGAIQQTLILNGSGLFSDGAILNVAGTNTWGGNILLAGDATFGASGAVSPAAPAVASILDITGSISDGGAGHNVTKEGTGEVVFGNANTYRGTTTINNGVLDIQNPNALGITDGGALTGVTVNESVTAGGGTILKAGTLRLDVPVDSAGKPTITGYTVSNVQLTLNGPGAVADPNANNSPRLGALDNFQGFNTWTGNVIVGSPTPNGHDATIEADSTDPPYTLTITGLVSEPNVISGQVPYNLIKTGPATVILTHANTYIGQTIINAGTLEITDSQALGAATGTPAVLPTTTVNAGGTLQLSVGNKTTPDSITGNTNTLHVSYPLVIFGSGAANKGALFSESGINIEDGTITLGAGSGGAAIGVAPDPNTTSGPGYLTQDYSLTLPGNLDSSVSKWTGSTASYQTLTKVGGGDLILPNAENNFFGNVDIKKGWITIQNSNSLGVHVNTYNLLTGFINIPGNAPASSAGIGPTEQPVVTVENGGALQLDPTGGGITVPQNLVLAGMGLTNQSYGLINQMGAVETLAGSNTLTGNVTLRGVAGIGVEGVFGATDLTLTGSVTDKQAAVAAIPVNANAQGGSTEADQVIDTGATSGSVTVNYQMYYIPDQLDIYYGIFAPGNPNGAILVGGTGGLVSGSGTVSVNYGPTGGFTSTFITLVMDQGGGLSGTAWSYTALVTPTAGASTGPGGITKLGSGRLSLQGDGTYTGPDDVQQGVLTLQNDTGLGTGTSGTTVEAAQTTNQLLSLTSGVPGSTSFNLSLNGSTTGTLGYTGNSVVDATAIATALNGLNAGTARIATITETGTTVTVTTSTALGLSTGDYVTISGVTPAGYNGTFQITVPAGSSNSFTYTATANLGVASVTNALLQIATPRIASISEVGTTVTVTTTAPHDLHTGDYITISGVTPAGYNGTFQITVTDPRTFTYTAAANLGAASLTGALLQTITVTPQIGASAAISAISETGSTVTVTTATPHGFNTGDYVTIGGVTPAGYNGTFQITVPAGSTNTFTYTAAPGLNAGTVAGANALMLLPGQWLVSFGGAFTPLDQSLGASIPTGQPGVISVITQRHGGGAALELGLTNPNNAGGITRGLNVYGEHLTLNGTGNTTFGDAPLTVLANSDQAYRGNITLDNSLPIQVANTSRLSFYGVVDDAANTSPGGSSITFIGGGALNLAGANSFRGTLDLSQGGVLTVQNGQALGGNGVAAVQNITLTGTPTSGTTTFTLTFSNGTTSATTGPIVYTGATTAAAIQSALNSLSSVVQASGAVTVTSAGAKSFNVSFGGNLLGFAQQDMTANVTSSDSGAVSASVATTVVGAGGTIVENGSAVQMVGNISVGGEPLQVQGQGLGAPASIPVTWFNIGPATLTNEANGAGIINAAGRVNDVAVDPTDPNVIYIATAGGGLWKTMNAGQTWLPIFDEPYAIYGGAVAIAPSNPSVIYFGTGESNATTEPPPGTYAGTGVYKSTDAGHTWQLLTTPATLTVPANPMFGLAVSRIVVDPANANTIFVATTDMANEGQFYAKQINPNLYTTPTVGVWRYMNNTWFNLTDVVSANRNPSNGVAGAPNTPGPDDDFRISFPQVDANWTDLALVGSSNTAADQPYGFGLNGPPINPAPVSPNNLILYVALGSNFSGGLLYPPGNPTAFVDADPANGLYRCENPLSATPVWFVGDMKVNGQSSKNFPTNTQQGGTVQNGETFFPDGTIKIAAFVTPAATLPGTAAPPNNNTSFVLESPPGNPNPTVSPQTITIYAAISQPDDSGAGLLEIVKSVDGGVTWAATKAAPNTFQGLTYLGFQGNWDNTIAIDPFDTTGNTVAIAGQDLSLGTDPYWVQITTDGGATWKSIGIDSNNLGPHTDAHGSTFEIAPNGDQVYLMTCDGGTFAFDLKTSKWSDLNGNISTLTMNSVATDPNNPNVAIEGSMDNGIGITTNITTGPPTWKWVAFGDGGIVIVDPNAPNNLYHIQNGFVFKSTQGTSTTANSWTTVIGTNELYPDLVIDPINSGRLLLGSNGAFNANTGVPYANSTLMETTDGGATWHTLSAPAALAQVTAIGVAGYQGNYVADPGFKQISDLGANTDDPNTVYITDGTSVYVTKNHGTTWVNRSAGLPTGLSTISYITVDPRNRDVVYLVSNAPPLSGAGKQRVLVSSNAGQTWTDITHGLPDVPVYQLVVDPRTNTLYLATDQGVYFSTNGGGTWAVFGVGLPQAQVTWLDLNQNLNTLTAATNGRAAFQVSLENAPASGGALSAESGTSVWTGPVILTGNTYIGAQDTPTVATHVVGPQLNIQGPIVDAILGSNNTLTKVGAGNVILSGAGTYGGGTVVQTGALIIHNSQALGGAGSTVDSLTLTGATGGATTFALTFTNSTGTSSTTPAIPFAGSTGTGATADATAIQTALNNLASIMNVGGSVTVLQTGPGAFTVNFGRSLAGQDQLPLQAQVTSGTPGSAAVATVTHGGQGTVVAPNASLKLQSSVMGEPLTIQGNGDLTINQHAVGAVENISGNNTYSGPITLANFSTVGVDAGSSLLVTGAIGDGGSGFGFTKELPGTLVLDQENTYSGGTAVNQGIITIESPHGLGKDGSTTTVLDGGQLQVQAPAGVAGITVPAESLRISGTGFGGTGALEGTGGNNTWAGAITLAQDPGKFPPTNPPANVGIGVLYTSPTDALVVSGPIGQASPFLGINKIGPGTLVLSDNANTYSGITLISNGAVRVQANGALGTPGSASLQGVIVSGSTSGSFTLGFDGATTGALPFGATAIQVQSALNALSTISGAGGSVSVTLTGNVYSISFGGNLSIGNTPALVGTGIAGTIVTVTTNGTTVMPGGALEVDGDPQGIGGTLTVSGEGVTLNGNGAPEVQQVTVLGTIGAFSLTFNGKQTSALPFNATAAQVQTALNGLPSILSVGGTVSVAQAPLSNPAGNVYTVIFGGTLANAHQPVMVLTPAGGASGSVVIARDGGTGAMHNISGNNAWTGPVVLQSAASVGAEPATNLTVNGVVEDQVPAAVPAGSFTKVGAGEVVLTNVNTYTGKTLVNAGILNIQASTATVGGTVESPLGAVASEVQSVTLSGPNTGSFTLTFNGQTTNPALPATASASLVQSELAALSTIGAGNVSVTQSGSTYTVSFQGALAGQNLPQMTFSGLNGTGVVVTTVQDGSEGTVVSPGATLQVQNNITIGSEGLTLNGNGAAEVQQVFLADQSDPFTLSFKGVATAPQAPNVGAPQLQAVLNALSSISSGGGFVTVTPTPSSTGILYTIAFGGSLANGVQPQFVAAQPDADAPSVIEITQGGLGNGSGGLTNEVQQILLPDQTDPFSLSFNGSSSTPLSPTTDPATLAAAISGLVNDTVLVTAGTTAGGTHYFQVTFNGPNLNSTPVGLLGISQPNTQPVVRITQVGGIGAIDSPSGLNTWSSAISLAGNTSVGADVDSGNTPSTLVLNTGIKQSTPSTLTKVGTGIAEMTGSASNTYTGLTNVNGGTLELNMTGGAIAVPANLTVGNGTSGLGADVAVLEGNSQIVNTATVTVNSDGKFDLNGNTQTIGALAMTGGKVSITGSTATLTVTGGVTAAADGNGNPATVSDVGTLNLTNVSPTITVTGPGAGAPAPDMVVQTPITASGITKAGGGVLQVTSNNPLVPASVTAGTLLADANPTNGETVGAVTLNGGTIAGSGSVVSIAPGTGGTILPGENTQVPTTLTTTTASGQTWNSSTKLNVVLNDTNPGDSSLVTVNGNLALGGSGTLGTGGAALGGFVSPSVQTGDQYVILQAQNGGVITGTFAQPFGVEGTTLPDGTANPDAGQGIAFVGGSKFDVAYVNPTNPGGLPTEVVLTRVIAQATVTLSTPLPKNTSVYGQGVTITATVTPENGAGSLQPQATVTFYLDGTSNPSFTTTLKNGQATFDPQGFYGQFLTIGSHTVSVTFNGDSVFAPVPADGNVADAPSILLTVTKANTQANITTSPTAPIPGQAVTVTAMFTPVKPGAGVPTGNGLTGSGGTGVSFTLDGQPVINPATGGSLFPLNAAGQGILVLNNLSASQHRVRAFYSGDDNFNGVSTSTDTLINVVKGAATIQVAATPLSSVFGQTVTFTATVSGPVIPSGTVTFYNGSAVTANIIANNVPLDVTGTGTFTISNLSSGVHSIIVAYSGNASYNGSNNSASPFSYTVSPDATQIIMTASPNPVALGTFLTLNATVTVTGAGSGTPLGNVSFMDGATVLGSVAVGTNGVTTSLLVNTATSMNAIGVHNLTAKYLPSNGNFATSTTTTSDPVNVQIAPAISVTSSSNPAVVGQAATLTATVRATPPGTGTPPAGESVAFTDITGGFPGISLGSQQLNGSGVAALGLNPGILSVGQHTIQVTYGGDGSFLPGTGTLVLTVVRGQTTTTVTSSATAANPAVYGLPLTFTVSVAAAGLASGVPTGSVFFYDGAVTAAKQLPGSALLDGTGTATYITSTLSAGSHQIIAVYGDDSSFAGSQGILLLGVNQASTSTTLTETAAVSGTGSAFFSEPVVFSATVGVTNGGGTPTGTVTFVDGTKTLGTSSLVGGVATLTVKTLALGSHNVTASYAATTNFAGSSTGSGGAVTVTVNTDPTNTVVSSANSVSLVGQTVTFTAAVTAASGGTGIPTGTVTFSDVTNPLSPIGLGTFPLNTAGLAFLPTSTLSQGSHSISATYNPPVGNANFAASTASPAWVQTVLYSSGVTVSGGTPTSPAYGQMQTLTATVFSKTAGSVGTPTGSVNFFADGKNMIGSGTLSGGTTTITFAGLTAGTHPITAVYVPDSASAFNGSTTTTAFSDVVTKAGTTTDLSGPSSSTYGASITYTATVTPAFTGGVVPTKTVTFYDGTTSLGTAPLSANGSTAVATFTISTLSAGVAAHNITAKYTGDNNYLASPSSPIVQTTVAQATTSLAFSSSADTAPLTAQSVFSQSVTFTAVVTAQLPGGGTPAGPVAFFVDGSTTPSATVNLNSAGVATWVVSNLPILPPGQSHSIVGDYLGNNNYQPAPVATESLTVGQDASNVTVTSASASVFQGTPVTLSAVVSAAAPGTGKPTGTVTFFDAASQISGAVTVKNGVAVFVATGLSLGTHDFTATYSGDTNFTGNTAPDYFLTVQQQTIVSLTAFATPTTVTATSAPTASNAFTITVKALDANRNVVANDNNAPVTLTVVGAPTGGAVSGSMSGTIQNGQFVFRGLHVNRIGTYRVRVNANGLSFTFSFSTNGRLS
jgi:autotransporter-associated beta strand protein